MKLQPKGRQAPRASQAIWRTNQLTPNLHVAFGVNLASDKRHAVLPSRASYRHMMALDALANQRASNSVSPDVSSPPPRALGSSLVPWVRNCYAVRAQRLQRAVAVAAVRTDCPGEFAPAVRPVRAAIECASKEGAGDPLMGGGALPTIASAGAELPLVENGPGIAIERPLRARPA